MNCKEHHLPELELATGQVREALQAILYTILLWVLVEVLCFIRAMFGELIQEAGWKLKTFDIWAIRWFFNSQKIILFASLAFLLFFGSSSIGSIRSPGAVTPRDVECEGFELTYPRIANDKMSSATSGHHSSLENDVDKKVDDAIGSFLLTLSQIGPELLSVSESTKRSEPFREPRVRCRLPLLVWVGRVCHFSSIRKEN